jgi:teichuronic acid biosynthesis glycosyltransferase TuaH
MGVDHREGSGTADPSVVNREPIRLLYLMHVDWDWIWQRPHALASELSRDPSLHVRVAYLPNWRRRQLTRNSSAVRRVPIPQLPLGRLAPVRVANRWLAKCLLAVAGAVWRPDAVFITFPTLLTVLPGRMRGLPLYDCMDLAPEFARDPSERRRLIYLEARLVARATRTFVPSEYVGHVLSSRYAGCVPTLVRNGYDAGLQGLPEAEGAFSDPTRAVRLGYFGTVAHWFDSALVLRSLDEFPWLEMHVWGPLMRELGSHERLHVHGPIRHPEIPRESDAMDALIMPFQVTDLIRGVDPVKLYEYLALGKPVITVYYPELERFRGLVSFYSTREGFWRLLEELRASRSSMLPVSSSVSGFLAESTWISRAATIADAIIGGPTPHVDDAQTAPPRHDCPSSK